MPRTVASILIPGGGAGLGTTYVFILAPVAVLLIVLGVWLYLNSRQTPAQRERRRRLEISRLGRMGDAMVIDVRECVLFYSYEVRGVAYTTSQDASDFRDLLPADTSVLIGPTGLKYSSKNPANSIVICEEWSGLRPGAIQTPEATEKENSRS
jgi:hypothetical protein